MISIRKLAAALLTLLPLTCAAQAQIGNPAQVGSSAEIDNAGSSLTITGTFNAGDLGVVTVQTANHISARTVSTVSDGTNSYSLAKQESISNLDVEIWYFRYLGSGCSSCTVTVTMTGAIGNGDSVTAQAWHATGIAASPLDSAGAAVNTASSTNWTVTSNALAQNAELVMGSAVVGSAQGTLTNSGSFTSLGAGSATNSSDAIAYRVTATNSAVTYTGTIQNTGIYAVALAPFKGASGALCTITTTGAGPC